MTTKCTLNRSILAVAAVLAVVELSGSALAAEQKPEVQRLFQSGSYEQAVDAARDGDPASTFIASQALLKLDRSDLPSRFKAPLIQPSLFAPLPPVSVVTGEL